MISRNNSVLINQEQPLRNFLIKLSKSIKGQTSTNKIYQKDNLKDSPKRK